MLRASRRVLRPGGRLAFTTIELADDVPAGERARVRAAGPRAVATRRPTTALLASAGLVDVGCRDVTDEYATTIRAWRDACVAHREELATIDAEVLAERLADWETALPEVEAGWLRRRLYWASAPGRRAR